MMFILWILLWWATICHVIFTPALYPVCLDKKAWRTPDWHLPTNAFIDIFNDRNRPWRHSAIKGFMESKNLPDYIVLSRPLLPTENPVVLELYSEAMKVVAEDDATPKLQKELAQDRFSQDTACWNLEVECQSSGWMLSWPWWSCTTKKRRKVYSIGTAQ
jgi:hypothetical protein